MRRRILIVGCGDVAQRAIPWLAVRFKVLALTRDAGACDRLRQLGAHPVLADLDDRKSLHRLAGIAHAVMHFAPPPPSGAGDPRTARLLAALATRRSLPQQLIYISTTGVYGDCQGAWIDETRPARPMSARAQRRVDAETRLRRFGVRNCVRVGILRAPGIYAADRLPWERLRRGDPILADEDDVHTNHIHAEDLARIACAALFRAQGGRVWNTVDETRMKMGEYFEFAADRLGLPCPPRLAREALSARLSPMALSFMSESRQISNVRLTRELRVRLRYPSVREGYAAALAAQPVLDGTAAA